MFYYKVYLLRSSAPSLTYCSDTKLSIGSVVIVPLKTALKEAVITETTEKPVFETSKIISFLDKAYSAEQMEMAKFISEYYFSSFSEAISLFMPYKKREVNSEKRIVNSVNVPTLSTVQQSAFEQLLQKDKALLFGVTGSGKTEIFISLFAKMMSEGKTCIFLMPEISLTPQMEKRLKVYFGDAVAMWHSKLTKKKKESILQEIEEGKIHIIAGARSALFVPLSNLGLIVVDEEHDDSYKAMTRPRYHARDVAVLMGQKLGAKVVLASATPSVSSYFKYDVVKLDKPYVQSQKKYTFIEGDSINHTILDALHTHYKAGNQSLLFLPTRGNFKYLYCENCGKTHLCPYCSVGMALHRKYKHLKCHYCNFTQTIVDTCTHCGHTPLKSERMGTVEAIEIISEAIEGIQIEQFDKDSITTANKLKEALGRFERGESQVLLGTQMLSKGHDYANITLSVIMGLDYILGLSDYRARERAVSLLFQIAGRSGRAKEAEVIVQTSDAAFFEQYLEDYEAFMKDELAFLKMAEYPPFVSLARILIAHKDEAKASKITLDTVTKLKAFKEIEIVGHGKAGVEKIANKYRFTILLRAKSRVPLLKALHSVDCREIEIDFDPVEFS
ncbi:MAG TPA: primosomal protein N' [Sulfurovum sp.]|nr:MAG: primosomal protein N' [Sulfurovum sp. 35-42-20]OYZ26869.1 MAG: primosomal protein N' [Sulfurovum sp. 16-42-52]OYZ49895.1 MAG: primosomal protein N' [Sulfurovum sp. 24-42-9]OZA45868.1 MAG: primosomal protein N' [Sulfurovum sp. 17-42-90]OZA60199.1 MAG: primosomal protein N' [Sulfurovum sp. 39-42-12]HQR73141.1 primosomal protein N' [Sulfurovum sp.]